MSAKFGIVHVSAEDREGRISRRELDRFEKRANNWRASGYLIAPVPKDGHEHPTDTVCPVCSGDA